MAETTETVHEQVPQEPRAGGGFVRFWTTLPGVLTAFAAILSAAVPLYLHLADGEGSNRDAPPVPLYVFIDDLDRVLTETGQSDALRDPVRGCMAGDAQSCARVAESLVDACDDGSGADCDLLYEVTDEGSELEWFGATCGYRYDTDLWAGECELVL